MRFRDLDPETVQAELQANPAIRILDVRTQPEYLRHRLPGAVVLLPVQELARRLHELDADAEWLVYCEHGRRSVVACELMAQHGFRRLVNLRGGMAHWIGRGLAVEAGNEARRPGERG
jgi:rhodanese-related sulfurtransferase